MCVIEDLFYGFALHVQEIPYLKIKGKELDDYMETCAGLIFLMARLSAISEIQLEWKEEMFSLGVRNWLDPEALTALCCSINDDWTEIRKAARARENSRVNDNDDDHPLSATPEA